MPTFRSFVAALLLVVVLAISKTEARVPDTFVRGFMSDTNQYHCIMASSSGSQRVECVGRGGSVSSSQQNRRRGGTNDSEVEGGTTPMQAVVQVRDAAVTFVGRVQRQAFSNGESPNTQQSRKSR
ncbi:predicted protein [Thalassiosira pseudonana CCMP1335]|uniref:Uncharacterized protein n=1 Tax=Thalassiosira pseudonana TaxID=35128 RepID=B8C2A0_THAPS|nr:predicted protein [Thalassiosira pseudonana CCMP1335]EED91911.1 predicted protein [Thalassiosira pseudonana CCMP1335]|eukprot:scaffold14940_cov200-Alexandrium_tamarense.AAC.7